MRGLKTWAWAVVIASTATPALAQQSGTTGTTGTGSTGGSTVTRTTTTGGITSSSTSSGTQSGSGSSTQTLQTEPPPMIAATTGNQTSSLQKSNRLAGYYANPYYQGSLTATNTAPGGFGIALYPATGTTGTTGRTGATGAAGRGQNSASTQSGILIPLPVQIAYSATMRFPTPPVATPKLQADLRGIIDAGGLSNAKTVQVVADANNNVTLRGTVKDDEEARLVEGLVRLTPGVGSIANELAYPVASK